MRDMIMPNVLAATKANPTYRFIVTGHSLGAALATIAAGDIRKSAPWFLEHTELFTFGAPRVGNVATADFLTKQSKKSYRITATADPVPRTPPVGWGYMHTSPEYWISRNAEDPAPEDIRVLTGFYNAKGNSETEFKTMEDHRKYFGYISKCDPDAPGEKDEDAWWRGLLEGILSSPWV